jgi:hypothetical protein
LFSNPGEVASGIGRDISSRYDRALELLAEGRHLEAGFAIGNLASDEALAYGAAVEGGQTLYGVAKGRGGAAQAALSQRLSELQEAGQIGAQLAAGQLTPEEFAALSNEIPRVAEARAEALRMQQASQAARNPHGVRLYGFPKSSPVTWGTSVTKALFDDLSFDPDTGRVTSQAVSEIETAIGAERANQLPAVTGRGTAGADLVAGDIELSVKRPYSNVLGDLRSRGKVLASLRDPNMRLLLDTRGVPASEIKEFLKLAMRYGIPMNRMIIPPKRLIPTL